MVAKVIFKFVNMIDMNAVMPEPGGQGGHWPLQYLSDLLTLFEQEMSEYPHLLLLAPTKFFTSGSTAISIGQIQSKPIYKLVTYISSSLLVTSPLSNFDWICSIQIAKHKLRQQFQYWTPIRTLRICGDPRIRSNQYKKYWYSCLETHKNKTN